ncbi:DUF4249 domain-containing protein [Mucilaginibacter ginkgonis]|uniref:DUF4249 domain-containing protein n=1 Tax=Mucilaginibacter ginkgonis TaxID=2682091 RepID=A0A6I4HUF5_9SPHI|nr:DUF4249 domain-containing protein [Mucilaginibacter ginkgonis]QQL50449.1 DUF4249 domain-containing protein [Mucilaginibacter ginkgonis]
MTIKLSTYRNLLFAVVALTVTACRQAYVPPVSSATTNSLVVEGLINVSADSTLIQLSRTVKLTDTVSIKPELNAQLSVENDAGANYNLTAMGKGRYYAVNHPLPASAKYRLRIKTADGKAYLSDYVQAKISPPIDSINWKAAPDKLTIYANTHDTQNATTYYKYSYAETWEFHSASESFLKTGVNIVVSRPAAEEIYTCWANANSTLINLASSAKLTQDVIFQNPITTISYDSEKLGIRYSTLVKQYALTKEAFDFWTNLKKNTEQLGSIFDAQPSVLSGNIHNTNDPAEVVVGYISAGTVSATRIFINKTQLPANYIINRQFECSEDSIPFVAMGGRRPVEEFIYTNLLIPLRGYGSPLTGYIATTHECADCTLRGVNNKPTFW